MTRSIERVAKIGTEEFVRRNIVGNRPVIVTDAMDSWPAKQKWNPEYFVENFGNLNTQIYDNLFALQDVMPLRDYINRCFNREDGKFSGRYARWYAKFKDLEFAWSDIVFDAIAQDWKHPYFLPESSFVMPFCRPPDKLRANRDAFPFKGLFISARGARTRLHKDPLGSDALLCQIHGVKKVVFYQPKDRSKLQRGSSFVDPLNPDLQRFADFPSAAPLFEDELVPGEILFIPGGWFHDVASITDSISVTWNFVHAAGRESFLRELVNPLAEFDREILKFFFRDERGRAASTPEIVRMAMSIELE